MRKCGPLILTGCSLEQDAGPVAPGASLPGRPECVSEHHADAPPTELLILAATAESAL